MSSQLNGEYGHKGVYLGVPTLINQNGAIKVYETPLSDNENNYLINYCFSTFTNL